MAGDILAEKVDETVDEDEDEEEAADADWRAA